MPRPVTTVVVLLLALAGCASEPQRTPAPEPTTDLETVTHLLPLDAIDGLTLTEELATRIAAARDRVPARVTRRQREALEELESRAERAEADAREARDADALGVALATYYWERLRVFDPSLEPDVPDELCQVLGTAPYRDE